MKNMRLALTAFAVFGLGASAFGVKSYEELVERRKQSIRDWEKVTSALKKAGVSENDSAYKRVHEALARNKTLLKNLETRGPKGRGGKAGKLATTAAGAAAGTGILDRLGGLFGGSKEAPATPEAVKAREMAAKKVEAKKADLKKTARKAKAKARGWGRRAKRSMSHPVSAKAPAKR